MSRIELAKYRLERAKEILIESKDSFKNGHYKLSTNRSYYAMFSATKALLALKELDARTHSGVILLFNQHFVKNGVFPKDLSKLLLEYIYDLKGVTIYVDGSREGQILNKITEEEARKYLKKKGVNIETTLDESVFECASGSCEI